ncbi:MAG TPA: PKD domain-containing protein, partial [Fimbriimonas sp.]|nr:PKD domain-containing protein [Fimbriimonas sp.]
GGGQGGGAGIPGGGAGPLGGPQGGGSAGVNSGLKTMRLIITTTDGKKSEAFVPASTTVGVERGWKQAGIPLQAIKGFDKTNKIVKEISFSGDVSTAFYVGDIRVISDRTPIRAEPSFRTALISVNQTLNFSASGYGGSSVLKYSWDFDDADGIQNDAEGANVKYRFRTASNDLRNTAQYRPNGEFTITLTVSDAFGLKEPYKTTLKVKVNP